MDKLSNIKKLLDKFYEGQSSLEEEQQLKEYFSGDGIPEELLEERELFVSMSAVDEHIEVPDNLNNSIIEAISNAEHRESKVKRINLYSFSGLAAGLAIILSVYFAFLREEPTKLLAEYTIQDEEVAYQEARKALSYVSAKLHKGTAELESLGQVNRTMKTLAPLNKITSGRKELQLLGNMEKASNIKL